MPRRKEPSIPDALLDQLLSGADPKTAFDPGGLLDGLKKALAERALNAEMDHHLAGENGTGNARNGYGRKTVTTDSGKFDLAVPRDRQASFDPQLVAKYQRRFPGFDEKIISMYARGMSNREIVGHLHDLYGVDVSPDLISVVTDAEPPPHEATHWTARAMAKAVGLGVATVQKIWKAHGLAPHRWRAFKLSRDPAFAEKLHAIVGLYVSPPAHAVVLSVDEKSQIQALDRTQPGLPLKRGRGATMTHDYKRNGTTTLFAALNVLDGTVFGTNMQRHRHQEFIRFLNALEREIPAGKIVHAILDNYAAHKTPEVRRWLARHPRWTFHFTPTSSSWLNAVEGFFAKLSRRRLKHGVFCSVTELQAVINRFVAEHNQSPKPFVWRADPDAIIAARSRGFQTLESIH